jgi:hypothetical protein
MEKSNVVALPPTPQTARTIAHRIRRAGFYNLPEPIWSGAADLAEYLADEEPTDQQRLWLWTAYQRFLQ